MAYLCLSVIKLSPWYHPWWLIVPLCFSVDKDDATAIGSIIDN